MRQAVLPFDPDLQAPLQALPAGSWDCHFHVFEDPAAFPLAAGRSYEPAAAPLRSYRDLLRTLGLSKAVLVQPSVYGSDHRLYEHLMQTCGDWMRGVAVVRAGMTEAQLQALDALGTRGTRINALFAAGAPLAEAQAIAAKVAPWNWHLQLCADVHAHPQLLPALVELGRPVVVDHMGYLPLAQAGQSAGFDNLLALLRESRIWVKLSGPYRLSAQRQGFGDCQALVARLIEANPQRLVWGSDWPHPAIEGPMVNDSDLLNALLRWVGDAQLLAQILVDNPSRLYGP